MGNVAAAYYGYPKSASTAAAPTRRHQPRSIATLKRSGSRSIRRAGSAARQEGRGEPDLLGAVGEGVGHDGVLEGLHLTRHNPQSGFAAVMVCSETDAACPMVVGASAASRAILARRRSTGAPFEAAKYASGATTSAASCSAS